MLKLGNHVVLRCKRGRIFRRFCCEFGQESFDHIFAFEKVHDSQALLQPAEGLRQQTEKYDTKSKYVLMQIRS